MLRHLRLQAIVDDSRVLKALRHRPTCACLGLYDRGIFRRLNGLVLVAALGSVSFVGAACRADGNETADQRAHADRSGSDAHSPVNSSLVFDVDLERPTTPFDRRLLGTNVPAWLGPATLGDPDFINSTIESGTTLLRMPGGSWSNSYDWAGCELRDPERCDYIGSARPSDFIAFLRATGLPGMWTVSINDTAQSAAAAVAFFNGDVADRRPIGTDRNGVEWGTVADWAQVRAAAGHARPMAIQLWEVGNEVYGGMPGSGGPECVEFGWEDVWTCDGTSYVVGDDRHDGYLSIRAAMRAVDSDIQVGAVGVGEPASWSNWGNEVIDGAAESLDFYVIHQYGFDTSPSDVEAFAKPAAVWPGLIDGLRRSLGADVPVAVTEYNLVAVADGDTGQRMTRAVNALYTAETIGQLAANGVAIANQWNLANGTMPTGTDYGMISVDDGSTFPQYDALRLWSRAGSEFLGGDSSGNVRSYTTRRPDGVVVFLLINFGADPIDVVMELPRGSFAGSATMTGVYTDDLDSTEIAISVDGVPAIEGTTLSADLRGWSITSIEAEVLD